jgi:hypothetical protein
MRACDMPQVERRADVAVSQTSVVFKNLTQFCVECPQFARGQMDEIIYLDQVMVHGALPWLQARLLSGERRARGGWAAPLTGATLVEQDMPVSLQPIRPTCGRADFAKN